MLLALSVTIAVNLSRPTSSKIVSIFSTRNSAVCEFAEKSCNEYKNLLCVGVKIINYI